MPKDYTALPYNQVRRSDRAVEDESWIKHFLNRAAIGVLATVYDGQPFINSNIFAYDESNHCIYMHTARVGRTQGNVDQNERVCFSISEMGRLLPADQALEFSVEYSGVVAFGNACVIKDPIEAKHGLELIMAKYAPHLTPGVDYRPVDDEEMVRTAVYRIEIESWSGKKKEVAPDFPGAYWFDAIRG